MVRATEPAESQTANPWSDIGPSTPLHEAARAVLRKQLRTVERLLAGASEHGVQRPRLVHQLRVATRRAAAALTLLEPCLAERSLEKARKALRQIRRAAGESRQAHVHVQLVRHKRQAAGGAAAGMGGRPGGDWNRSLSLLERAIRRQLSESHESIVKLARRWNADELKRLRRRLLNDIVSPQAPITIADAARRAAAQQAEALIDSNADLQSVEVLHRLRLAGKRARYLFEIAEQVLGAEAQQARVRLENVQDRLGAINDLEELVRRIESLAARAGTEDSSDPFVRQIDAEQEQFTVLAADFRAELRNKHQEFIDWWHGEEAEAFRAQIRAITLPQDAQSSPILDVDSLDRGIVQVDESPATTPVVDASEWPKRIAAIDVGTNSVRLVIAEVYPDRRVRIIDDERAVTRLGRGLSRSGELSSKPMNESILALQQFKAIAEGYKVNLMRAVATCAVREARNGRDFVAQVRRVAGVDLQVISAQTEARLAFASVSNAFDLTSTRTAVIDLGGGSTEIILGSGHLIEQVYSLPVGAIRLTEKFGLDDNIPDDRYREMRQYIKRMLKTKAGRPPFVPHQAIGTGGTFTALAAMSMQRGAHAKPSEFLPFNVRGYELQRSELKHILDQLRGLSLNERLRVPGLVAERADIIVAGLSIIDLTLKHLQVNTLHIHDQGVRGGLLQAMVDELLPTSRTASLAPTADRIRAVRQFATACNFEQEHSEQVTRLSLMIFDLLARELGAAAKDWATAENREILHAAALLHDVGYFINYSRHHKHTYHLVMHSDLPGFTHRQREIIANVGRYHRGAEPKKAHDNYARLKRRDRELVKVLSAILRVADGLDRSHTSNIRSLEVRCHEGVAFIRLVSERDATVDVWGAMRKSELFERVFDLKIRFSCAGDSEDSADVTITRRATTAQQTVKSNPTGNGSHREVEPESNLAQHT